MVKKPAATKASAATVLAKSLATPKAAKVDPNKHVIADLRNEVHTLEQQKAELKADLDRALADCSEWVAKCRQFESENQQLKHQLQQLDNSAHLKLAQIRELLKPFIACARGEGMTTPQDWEALKQL